MSTITQDHKTMSDFRNRPAGDFSTTASWEELFALTRHWVSDLQFYQEDLRFLHRLIDRYFIWITDPKNLEEVRTIGNSILEHEKGCRQLIERIGLHQHELGDAIEDPVGAAIDHLRDEHEALEDEMAIFIKAVRENRKEVFRITEHVVDSEHLVHLLEK